LTKNKEKEEGFMIKRYTGNFMESLWAESYKKSVWHMVENAVLSAKRRLGIVPPEVSINAACVTIDEPTLKRADEIEKITDHDLIAFVSAVSERLDEETRKHYHVGLTSFDIEDTAQMLILKQNLECIESKLKILRGAIFIKAQDHRYTLEIGRTHFIHAEPITFGFKLLGWVDVIDRHLKKLEIVKEEISIGKFSGAVGMYQLDPEIEKLACQVLDLKPAKIATQVLSRDLHVHYSFALVAIANSLERFAVSIRHLAGTDISEVAEFKKPGAKGSSAMPGKSKLRNPIKSENISGLAKMARGYFFTSLECEILWEERSLDNSAPERIYLPDLSILVDFMLSRFTTTIEKLEVFPEQMERNIWRTGGIVFAQTIMIELTKRGMTRDDAYNLLESLALSTEHGTYKTPDGKTFRDLVYQNEIIKNLLSQEELDQCFDPKRAIRQIDTIFARFE
jgi:adenylosuccinate lyase